MLKYSIVAWFDDLLHQANPDDHAPTPLVPADFAALEFLTNVHEIIFRIIETYEDPELDIIHPRWDAFVLRLQGLGISAQSIWLLWQDWGLSASGKV